MTHEVFSQLAHVLEHGAAGVLVTVVACEGSAPAPVGAKMLVYGGNTIGTVGGGALEVQAREHAERVLSERQSTVVTFGLTNDVTGDRAVQDAPTGMICGGRVTLFFDYVGPSLHLYMLGGGHVGQALCRHCQGLGFFVTVIDHRPEIGEVLASWPTAPQRVVVADYVIGLADETPAPGAYYVIATPEHAHDYAVLKTIMASDWRPAYVGMVGSRAKVLANASRLRQELANVPWSALYSPVGLSIGGRSPDEIALAILAEIQALRYGKTRVEHLRLALPDALDALDEQQTSERVSRN